MLMVWSAFLGAHTSVPENQEQKNNEGVQIFFICQERGHSGNSCHWLRLHHMALWSYNLQKCRQPNGSAAGVAEDTQQQANLPRLWNHRH